MKEQFEQIKRDLSGQSPPVNDSLDAQRQQWETSFRQRPDMFGQAASDAATRAAELFRREGIRTVLELGGGQGRDSLYFSREGFDVSVLDYSPAAVEAINAKAAASGIGSALRASAHDIRKPLPFPADSFDACYSHMLYCMALTTPEIECLTREVWRVLRPGGLNVYTVRHTGDAHFGTGIHRGEDMWEVGGFTVHFFSRDKVIQLAKGFAIVAIDEFEEGGLPRKLFRVTLRK